MCEGDVKPGNKYPANILEYMILVWESSTNRNSDCLETKDTHLLFKCISNRQMHKWTEHSKLWSSEVGASNESETHSWKHKSWVLLNMRSCFTGPNGSNVCHAHCALGLEEQMDTCVWVTCFSLRFTVLDSCAL